MEDYKPEPSKIVKLDFKTKCALWAHMSNWKFNTKFYFCNLIKWVGYIPLDIGLYLEVLVNTFSQGQFQGNTESRTLRRKSKHNPEHNNFPKHLKWDVQPMVIIFFVLPYVMHSLLWCFNIFYH